MLFQAFRTAEEVHKDDKRANGWAYIKHPIELVQSMIHWYGKRARIGDLITLILHDVIEDHPDSWKEVYNKFGIHVFRNVLILSKISRELRKEMLGFFVHQWNIFEGPLWNIVQILDPTDPVEKFERFSHYSENLLGQDAQRFLIALQLYKQEILDEYSCELEAHDEYVSLWNYLYFTSEDAKRKLQDMLNNMSDMAEMEKKKPGYIERRRIKAYILGVKLRNFGLKDEYAELQGAFQCAWYNMYDDAEVHAKLKLVPTTSASE